MAPVTERPLESGWLPDTPVEDTLLRRFVHNQAEVNAEMAGALGGRADRTDDVFLADAASPVPYFNQAIPARPLAGLDDPVLDVIDRFFETGGHPATVLSIWPTRDLSTRGWSLIGHPAVVVRAPGPTSYEPPPGLAVRVATSPEVFAAAERVAVDGYPLHGARDLPMGSVFPPSLADTGLVVRLGLLHGEAVGVGNRFTGHGLVNLCLAATLPAARRRGVWEALVWSRVLDAPDLPAIAYTSDDSRPGFIRMGFLPITRFTLWERPGRPFLGERRFGGTAGACPGSPPL
ncbi:MAG TPA: hypothetical protein VE623_02145 [Acidimicrobiales bacterium]|nr:hypothetical protein [Acidimicrobiales bacterium]